MAGFKLGQARVSEWAAHGSRAVDGHGADEHGHHSDDEDHRSIAADSWSVKSEYGSTLDGEDTRTAEVMEVMATVEDRGGDSLEDGEEGEGEEEEEERPHEGEGASVLGLRSHWDSVYVDELANFHQHGQPGEIWFGEAVMETVAEWTARLAAMVAGGGQHGGGAPSGGAAAEGGLPSSGLVPLAGQAASWRVLDVGTGNGLMLQALAKHGFRDLTGTDYCEAAVVLARAVTQRAGLAGISFVVDDILDTRLEGKFELVIDKGTLDAVRLHPEGRERARKYRDAVAHLVTAGGLLVITSCNSTKEELISEIVNSQSKPHLNGGVKLPADPGPAHDSGSAPPAFEYVDHVRTYPSYRFGGVEGSRVCTVAFKRRR